MRKVPERGQKGTLGRLSSARAPIVHYLLTFIAIVAVSLVSAAVGPFLDLASVALLYLLPVLISAVRWGQGPSFFASFLGVLAFDYFFVPPIFGFNPSNPRDYFILCIFLLVALVTGTIATRLRSELEKTSAREKRTAALYAVSENIASENDLQRILRTFAENVANTINGKVVVLIYEPNVDAPHEVAAFPPGAALSNDEERMVVRGALVHGQSARRVAESVRGKGAMFFPVKTEDKTIAVLAITPDSQEGTLVHEQIQLIEAFANLAAIAITRVRASEEAEGAQLLAESRKLHLAAIVESSADAIISVDLDGVILSWNAAAETISGYSAEDVIGKAISTIVSYNNDDNTPLLLERVKKGERVQLYETAQERKDGTRINVSLTISPIRDASGQIVGVSTIARDITEIKRKEDQLRHSTEQLRALSARLQSIREEERTNLARDIHDELGQTLTGLMMDLVSLSQKPPRNRQLLIERIQSMEKLVDDTIRVVRRLSAELRPGILDDLGLVDAIEWQTNDFKKRTQIQCEFSSTLGDIDISREIATALFRILQETLTNIVRHANATNVIIKIQENAGLIILIIEDNGRGIAESEIHHPNSLGLLGISERALMLGGEAQIMGIEGRGTRVVVKIPSRLTEGHHA